MNIGEALNEKEYELTFEGKGSSYLYNATFCRHSLPKDFEFISVVHNGFVKEFLSKRTLNSMNKEGEYLTPERVRAAIIEMNAKVLKEQKDIGILLEEPLTIKSILEVFKRCGEVALTYAFFDPHYFEVLYGRPDAEAKTCIALLQDYKNTARDYLNGFYFEEGFIPRLLKRLSKESGVQHSDLLEYDETELGGVLDGAFVKTDILENRRSFNVLIKDANMNMTVYTGAEAREYAKRFFSKTDKDASDVLIGKCAHDTGKVVRGRVRVITRDYTNKVNMIEEMLAMEPNEILVTQTTDPEMLPALKKASAAVTDIGGMLSHTAITSRELNIPCIVGTRSATKILKNGDLIEVDAKNGLVRRLG